MDGYVYLLELLDNIYKIGHTYNIHGRLATHRINLCYRKCVKIWQYLDTETSRASESQIKKFLRDNDMIIKYTDIKGNNLVEIFKCDDISTIIKLVTDSQIKFQKEYSDVINIPPLLGRLVKPQINNFDETPNDRKCYDCEKVFGSPSDYKRHVNKKTPCLIRDIKPENIEHPNRCTFCNKVFTSKYNLIRHFGRCKIKNNNTTILVKETQHEEPKPTDTLNLYKIIKEMREEIDSLKKQINNKNETINNEPSNIPLKN